MDPGCVLVPLFTPTPGHSLSGADCRPRRGPRTLLIPQMASPALEALERRASVRLFCSWGQKAEWEHFSESLLDNDAEPPSIRTSVGKSSHLQQAASMEQSLALMEQLSPGEREAHHCSPCKLPCYEASLPPPTPVFLLYVRIRGVAGVTPQALQARAHMTHPPAQHNCFLIPLPMSRPTPIQTSITHMHLELSLN